MRRYALVLTILATALASPAAAQSAKPLFNVAPDGVSLVDPATGRSRNLTFGTSRETVIVGVKRALGKVVAMGTAEVCDAGPLAYVEYRDGITLNFQGPKFVGWSLSRGTPRITNAAGIGIGSSRTQLIAAVNARIVPSTLGTEFRAGGLSGLLSGRAQTARITDMWAGTTCIAR